MKGKFFKKSWPIAYIFIVIFIFFWPFFSKLLLPIPADDIAGLYHPFQDFFAKTFTRGIPYKNYLITDPIKQQYPWRELAINLEKKLQLPLWNPYSLSGTPLLANFQSAAFYPLNLLFFVLPFPLAWSALIVFQPLLAAIFLYFYLDNLRLNKWASMLGGIVFAFSGFFTSWLEWGTILHVGLWLPLILLSIDKIFLNYKNKNLFIWSLIFVFSLTASFFAGHLQTFFYLFVISIVYFLVRWMQLGKIKKVFLLFLILCLLFLILTFVQWVPTLRFILLSARDIDQANWQKNPGWFIPWQHLIQFVAPDFFGNPATLNYWSVFNYGEFTGYVGIFPLVMAFLAIFFRRDKKTIFFSLLCFIGFIFSFPTLISQLPFVLHVPLLSTSQPTRIMFIIDFSLAVLSAFGLDYYLRNKKKILMPLIFLLCIFFIFWVFVFTGSYLFFKISTLNLSVAKHNLYLPSIIFVGICISAFLFSINKNKRMERVFLAGFFLLTVFDLLRFSIKYNPFTSADFLYPQTKTISFLQQNKDQFRIMTSDSPVFPPNFSVVFRLQSVDGYDPLYLTRYAELISASEKLKSSNNQSLGFNKVIIPHNFDSRIADLLGVRYFLSRIDIKSKKIFKVFQEGKTRVYENPNAFPRAFFVQETLCMKSKDQVLQKMLNDKIDLRKIAFLENQDSCTNLPSEWSDGKIKISSYTENKITVETQNDKEGFLVFVDSFYPAWHAKIYNHNNNTLKDTKIYLTDFNFRGIVVPPGKNTVEFYITLL